LAVVFGGALEKMRRLIATWIVTVMAGKLTTVSQVKTAKQRGDHTMNWDLEPFLFSLDVNKSIPLAPLSRKPLSTSRYGIPARIGLNAPKDAALIKLNQFIDILRHQMKSKTIALALIFQPSRLAFMNADLALTTVLNASRSQRELPDQFSLATPAATF